MPKLFVYLGVIVFFYSKEHEPIHVHGFCQGRESKAEIVVRDGKVVKIAYSAVAKMKPLRRADLAKFRQLVEAKADDIVQKWIDYFVLHKSIKPEIITRRLL